MKIPFSSLWQREVRRDFYYEEIIHKISPHPSLEKRGIFVKNTTPAIKFMNNTD
jgi:hypothetical protein